MIWLSASYPRRRPACGHPPDPPRPTLLWRVVNAGFGAYGTPRRPGTFGRGSRLREWHSRGDGLEVFAPPAVVATATALAQWGWRGLRRERTENRQVGSRATAGQAGRVRQGVSQNNGDSHFRRRPVTPALSHPRGAPLGIRRGRASQAHQFVRSLCRAASVPKSCSFQPRPGPSRIWRGDSPLHDAVKAQSVSVQSNSKAVGELRPARQPAASPR